jgi:hypothetical protein
MTPEQAVYQIRNTIFKPGWDFSASRFDETQILVQADIHTVDTSYVNASGHFYRPVTLPDTKVIDVSGLDEQGLCYELLKMAQATNLHEDREFMQVRQPDGSWTAPLHPHVPDAERAWQRLGGALGVTPDDLDPFSVMLMDLLENYGG